MIRAWFIILTINPLFAVAENTNLPTNSELTLPNDPLQLIQEVPSSENCDFTLIESIHCQLSKAINFPAKVIDGIFVKEQDENKGQLRVRYRQSGSLLSKDYLGETTSSSQETLDVNLKLPSLEKWASIDLSTTRDQSLVVQNDEEVNRSFSTKLVVNKSKSRFELGIEFDEMFYVFGLYNYRYPEKYQKWQVNQTLFWRQEQGYLAKSSFRYKLYEKLQWQQNLRFHWQPNFTNHYSSIKWLLYQSKQQSWIGFANHDIWLVNGHWITSNQWLGLNMRQQLFWSWFYLDVSPQAHWSVLNNYELRYQLNGSLTEFFKIVVAFYATFFTSGFSSTVSIICQSLVSFDQRLGLDFLAAS